MNITQEEITRLERSSSEKEWNSICDDVKRARGGQYPPDWFQVIVMGGIARDAQLRWK